MFYFDKLLWHYLEMKHISLLLALIFLVGCSKSPSTLSIVCEGGSTNFFDEAYTFNFDTSEVQMSKFLNAYGSSQKSLVYERLDSNLESGNISEDLYIPFDKAFSEDNSKMIIRSVTDGFITFGYAKESNELFDIEWILNRASLQIKRVTKIAKSAIPENDFIGPETTTFMDCKKPTV